MSNIFEMNYQMHERGESKFDTSKSFFIGDRWDVEYPRNYHHAPS